MQLDRHVQQFSAQRGEFCHGVTASYKPNKISILPKFWKVRWIPSKQQQGTKILVMPLI
jgi:hypothetical protein